MKHNCAPSHTEIPEADAARRRVGAPLPAVLSGAGLDMPRRLACESRSPFPSSGKF
ncbi:hypothetical protein PATSB16_21160 [Pandoraea thiooxydans]|nr:hypothetical protein PATSB16_21160 [Pandoraea thiooxydans]